MERKSMKLFSTNNWIFVEHLGRFCVLIILHVREKLHNNISSQYLKTIREHIEFSTIISNNHIVAFLLNNQFFYEKYQFIHL